MTDSTIDRVLTAPPPTFTDAEAASFAKKYFGVDGNAVSAGSERDQTFLIGGDRPSVLKISNAAETRSRLELEELAAQRVAQLDPEIPVALPIKVHGRQTHMAYLKRGANSHYLRLYDQLPRASFNGPNLNDQAIREWGVMVARVGQTLRGFWHPRAGRVMLWDAQHALKLRPLLDSVHDVEVRHLVSRALDRYERVVTPVWPTLRAQVIHTDLCASNVLVDGNGRITGIIDFGDASWSALVVDLAAALESVTDGREGYPDEFFRVCRLLIDGYEKVTPLEPQERAIVGELLAARMCAAIVVPAWRAHMYEEPDKIMASLRGQAAAVLRLLEGLGWTDVQRRLGGREPGAGWTVPALVERRARVLGPAMTPPTYREPLHFVRGDGVWLIDADGRRYLDAYNNVPVVGHEHPRVVEAVARQARRLNTNMRYLHETALEVAERLIASTGGALDTVMFVNSGSEANDVAWRIARAATGRDGGLTTEWAYHGITDAISALTPEDWGSRPEPMHVRTWRPPDPLRGFQGSLESLGDAMLGLRGVLHPLAAAIMDGVLTSDGIIDLPAGLAEQIVQRTHDAHALWIADEVQSGHGRTGATMWGYQRLGIVPDIVTIGKPMGNGMPVAAVLTRRELARQFSPEAEFFSTFGGNPVAMAAALAVLEVMDDEHIIDNAAKGGQYTASRLRDLATRSPMIGEVRAVGLAIGVEIVRPGSVDPDRVIAREIVEAMRHNGVLIGTTGRHGNTLKIRPPLVFQRPHADQLVSTLESVLGSLTSRV